MPDPLGKAFVGVVHVFYEDVPDKPLAVGIRPYHAVYYVHRDDPSYGHWRAILEQSKRDRTPVAFTYADEGQRITSLTLLPP